MKSFQVRGIATVAVTQTIYASSEDEAMEIAEDFEFRDWDVDYDEAADVKIDTCEPGEDSDDDDD